MSNYVYDAATNAFYPLALQSDYESAGAWPEKAISVSDDVFYRFTKEAPEGKKRASGNDGMPVWIDIPKQSNDVILSNIISTLGMEYKNDIAELNAAYLSAIVNDGPSEVTKQQLVRDKMAARKEKYMSDISEAKSQYPT